MRFSIEPRDVPPEVAARRLGMTLAGLNAVFLSSPRTQAERPSLPSVAGLTSVLQRMRKPVSLAKRICG